MSTKPAKKLMRKPSRRKRVRRVVLGVGHPWFFRSHQKQYVTDAVQLTQEPVSGFVLFRGNENLVPLEWEDLGNWNRIRLVAEVIE